MHANHTTTTTGKKAAICQCCSARSRPVKVDDEGEPSLWAMPRGWSCAPFPADFTHRDGSTGSTYTCAACNKRLRAGERLKLRAATVFSVSA